MAWQIKSKKLQSQNKDLHQQLIQAKKIISQQQQELLNAVSLNNDWNEQTENLQKQNKDLHQQLMKAQEIMSQQQQELKSQNEDLQKQLTQKNIEILNLKKMRQALTAEIYRMNDNNNNHSNDQKNTNNR